MKYQYYLPTYEECKEICDKYDNFQFYEQIVYIDEYKVSTFNYRLVGYNDFNFPLGENSPVKAWELRGISYVFNEDGTLFKRYLLMNKFFNLNQVEETQYSLIKNIPVKYIENKIDGSVINFIKLPNGKILPKTKMCHDNNQAIWSNEIYNNTIEIKEMVSWCLDRDIMPIMEFISPKNRVVLKYKVSELILLKFRDLNTGEYLDLDIYPEISKIKCAEKEQYKSFEEILPLVDTLKDKEGWVITLETGMMIKQKIKHYCDLHHTLTESIHREDYLIEKVVDEEIDDVISLIDPDDKEILAIIDDVIVKVHTYIKSTTKKLEEKVNDFYTIYNGSKKEFAINYKNRDKYFSYVMLVIDGKSEAIDIVKKDLKNNTKKLELARSFIKNCDF